MSAVVSAGWRVARGGVLGVAVVALSYAGHIVGGGSDVSPGALATLCVLVCGLAAAGTGAIRSWYWILAAVIGSQVVLHPVLAFLPTGGHSAGLHSHAMASAAVSMQDMATHNMIPGAGMFAAHIVAAVALAVVLRYGESMVAIWLELAMRLVGASAFLCLPSLPNVRIVRWVEKSCDIKVYCYFSPALRRGPPAVPCTV